MKSKDKKRVKELAFEIQKLADEDESIFEDLDDQVHSCASSIASDTNNTSIEAQAEYLAEHLGLEYLENLYKTYLVDNK